MRPTLYLPLASVLTLLLAASCKPADTLAPRWDVHPAPPSVIVLGDPLPEFQVLAEDNRDFDIAERVVVDGQVNPDRWGDYPLTYRATDAAGNSTDTSFSITVTMAPRSYWSTAWSAQDSCADGSMFSYTAGIQDCDCPEDQVQLFNLGNFGPGSYVDLDLAGDFLERFNVSRSTSSLTWAGTGSAARSGDTLQVDWTVDNGATVLQCRTELTR